MVLPIIMLLFALLFTVGSAIITQAEVSIESREDAWLKREPYKAAKVFHVASRGNQQDILSGTAKKPLMAIINLAGSKEMEAKHSVLAGAWDHDELPMDNPIHWKLIGDVIRASKISQAQSILGLLGKVIELFSRAGSSSDVTSKLQQANSSRTQQEKNRKNAEEKFDEKKREAIKKHKEGQKTNQEYYDSYSAVHKELKNIFDDAEQQNEDAGNDKEKIFSQRQFKERFNKLKENVKRQLTDPGTKKKALAEIERIEKKLKDQMNPKKTKPGDKKEKPKPVDIEKIRSEVNKINNKKRDSKKSLEAFKRNAPKE